MNNQELIDYLALGEKSANDLLKELNPNIEKRFLRAFKNLAKLLDEVRIEYPDANIYVEEDIPLLLLGDSHTMDSSGKAQPQMTACSSYALVGKITGGGW